MPTITIYLTNELYDKVKSSPSKIVRAALEHYFKNEDAEVDEAPENAPLLAGKSGKNEDTSASE